MSKHAFTLAIVGKAGPYQIDGEALANEVELILNAADPPQLDVRLPDGEHVGANVADLEVLELHPGQWAVKGNAWFDDETEAPHVRRDSQDSGS